MKNKITFLFSSILSVCFCNAQPAFSKEQLRAYLPKKEAKFKLPRQFFNDSTVISTNAIYIKTSEEEEQENYQVTKRVESFIYLRFFNDGRIFISFPYLSYPNNEEFNDLTYGKFGRYVVKDKEIKIELYMDKEDGMMYMFANPVANGIQFYKSTGTGVGEVLKVSKTTDEGFYRKDYAKLDDNVSN